MVVHFPTFVASVMAFWGIHILSMVFHLDGDCDDARNVIGKQMAMTFPNIEGVVHMSTSNLIANEGMLQNQK